MPSDLTRPPTGDLRQHYKAVVMQQGRVILDRDFNAMQDLVNGRIAADALDEIGPCGTPNDGLAISVPPSGQSVTASASVSFSSPQPWDFLINPGTMYVGGQRIVFDAPAPPLPPLSYFQQPDWLNPPNPFSSGSASHPTPQYEFIYLHASEQEVGSVEDPDLLDVALGGPDTSQRVRLRRRIVRLGVAGTDCTTALVNAQTDWGLRGYLFDPATMRLLPQVALQVGFTGAISTSNPCDPVAQGGYLGAENQLIRVMIANPGSSGGSPSLLWGYDNASSLYRVSVNSTGTTLQLSQPPVDAFHNPATNQCVEVLRTATILGTEPDQTDPTGQRTIIRCVAEATGYVTTVASYNSGQNSLILNSALPSQFTNDSNPLFLRVWVGQQSFDPSSTTPVILTDPTPQALSPGLQVTITQPATAAKGAALPSGAFWLFAVRPSTPQAIYPERFLTGPQSPDGPRQWVCPLAVIDWVSSNSVSVSTPAFSAPAAVIHDCRSSFENLTTLTTTVYNLQCCLNGVLTQSHPIPIPNPNHNPDGCCTIRVGPSDAFRLQDIIDHAVGKGQVVCICFTPGIYSLPQPLRLSRRHSQLVLKSSSGGATLQAALTADPTMFLDGLIVLAGAESVSLHHLWFELPSVPLATALSGRRGSSLGAIITHDTKLLSMIGIRVAGSRDVTIEGCRFGYSPRPHSTTFGTGVFAEGDCRGLVIRGCRFESDRHPTVTPLSSTTTIAAAAAAPLVADPPQRASPGQRGRGRGREAATTAPPPAPPTPPPTPPGSTGSFTEHLRQHAGRHSPRDHGPPEFVALYGFLAMGSWSEDGESIGAVLDGAIDDCEFRNLTLGILVHAEIGSLQVRGNRMSDCFAGFWLEASDFACPCEISVPLYQNSWEEHIGEMIRFWEIIPIYWLGLFPWPAGERAAQQTNEGGQSGVLSLSVTDNRIDVILSHSTLTGTALALLLSRQVADGFSTSTSLILASNELRGRSPNLPVGLISTSGGNKEIARGPSALTGNLVLNSGTSRHPSLILYPQGGLMDIWGLAITGNVLIGYTTVFGLTQWAPLNSILQ
jgi:hypothetical protein